MVQGSFKWHQYQVVGRLLPTEAHPSPEVYRMKIWATDALYKIACGRRYFLSRFRKAKKANGQILAVNEIFEKKPTATKNYGIWVRYQSRTGYHNMYKEYRDLTLNGAVEQMYTEMASRHRVRAHQLHIIKTTVVKPADCKRVNITQFHDSKIQFPMTRKSVRPESRVYKSIYKASRPNVAAF